MQKHPKQITEKYWQRRLLYLFFILLIAGMQNNLQAQKLFFLFVHGTYANPADNGLMGDYKIGLGGELGAGVKLIGKTYGTATIGYDKFLDRDQPNRPGNMNIVPVRFGLRQNFLPLNILYIHADVGSASVKNNLTDGSRFNGSFGAGVKLGPLEAQLDYETMGRKSSDPSGSNHWIAIKAGWRFGL